MSKKNSVLSYSLFRGGFAWILLIFGVFLYIAGYILIDSNNIWKEIVIKIADVLVIGVVIGYVTSAAKFLGIFKQELENIIYCKEFIKKRNDLPLLWENITKQMFKEKFPTISKDLLSIIKDNYLPVDVVNYYQDYDISIDIAWVDEEHEFVIVKENISFDIIAMNDKAFELTLSSWLNVEGLQKDEYYSKITEFKVNGIDAKNKDSYKTSDNIYSHTIVVEVSGCTKYEVIQKREKKYLFDRDFDICFKAKYLIHKMKLDLAYPSDMEINVISRGTINEFHIDNSKNCRTRCHYRGLLLPKQGYVVVLNRKKMKTHLLNDNEG